MIDAVRLVAASIATGLPLLATFMKVNSAIESAGNKLVAMREDGAGGLIVCDVRV